MKIKEFVEDWKTNKREYIKKSSMSSYNMLIRNHIIPHFGDCESISEEDIQAFVLEKSKSLSHNTIRDILIVLKMILKFGKKNKIWNSIPPFEDILYPNSSRGAQKIQTLNANDYRKAVNYVKNNFSFKNFGILLCLSTGMRIGEICALKWSDFDMNDGTINVDKTLQRIYVNDGKRKTEIILDSAKTVSSNRTIPMSKDLIAIIKPLKKIIKEDYYVLSNAEKPVEPRTYRKYYYLLVEKMGIPMIKFHSLRHSFATQCIAANIDVKVVSVILGHSNVSTTFNLYVHPNTEQKKNAIDKLFKSIK